MVLQYLQNHTKQQKGVQMSDQTTQPLHSTALATLHESLSARMVPFAGYSMPIQYPSGILSEHHFCRKNASIFDVSHMGQVFLHGNDACKKLEQLCAADLQELAPGKQVYTQLLNETGTIIDDLMVAKPSSDSPFANGLMLVINAARKTQDLGALEPIFKKDLERMDNRAMIALQGPMAEQALCRLNSDVAKLNFMEWALLPINSTPCIITRSGYTGEDGFEISMPDAAAISLVETLLKDELVELAGLGARDTLRLEAGLCLYGQDIDETTSPVEAGLTWSIGKRRRRDGGFQGDDLILRQLREGATRKLTGLVLEGRSPLRTNTLIANAQEKEVGRITSGGISPSSNQVIAMAYIKTDALEHPLMALGRKDFIPATRTKLPFVPHRYKRN